MWGEFVIRLRYEWNFKGELQIRPTYRIFDPARR